ncbi:TLP18.3, Psb32 and MOLO-1 founding protein of phosphatase [Pseudomonas sp. OF001]|uniref:TPM domain-containing protein n=1 Tax=Pseudomonas sp. OF001 TaxID=2772300 RepID=UPI0019186A94|nr:TPM domain-containing protein [Pseudomonas sp. OF001]CAD5378632.1 TLP18.3, Psb32 and MOLO-1 founding protein of phosphatase [Pseudomonas sp. OF001]
MVKNNYRRVVRHLTMSPRQLKRAFPPQTLNAIQAEIAASECTHAGQIRFAVEGALQAVELWRGQSPRERALEVFSLLRAWDTEHNNGVLIYLLLADRDVEIVADRGIHAQVGASAWEEICLAMEQAFRLGRFEEGALEGIRAVTRLMAQHFPATAGGRNELPDQPVLL